MNRRKDLQNNDDGQHCSHQIQSPSGSSVYSTCSNSFDDEQITVQSAVLAGQEPGVIVNKNRLDETYFNETNYTISPLDQNLYILEDADIYEDCQNENKSSLNDSTEYIPFEAMSKLTKNQTNNSNCNNCTTNDISRKSAETQNHSLTPPRLDNIQDKLLTIMEETEVTRTTNSVVAKNLPEAETTGELLVEFINSYRNTNKVATKKVLFANAENLKNNEQEVHKLKFRQKTPMLLASRKHPRNKSIDENSNKHNTTESFIMWEKYCEASERCNSRKSCSFSELNTSFQNYEGDNECSTSYKTLDDSFIQQASVNSLTENDSSQARHSIYRSKSCDDLLREVKHLPHVLYDRFLKSLAKEIENIRKQKVYCNCPKRMRKPQSEENSKKNYTKNLLKPPVMISYYGGKTDSKMPSKNSALNVDRNNAELSSKFVKSPVRCLNGSNLSPNVLKSPALRFENLTKSSPEVLKDTSHSLNVQRLCEKSYKTPSPTIKRKVFWHKEIVSPVGEYIRGKRPSPYKSSPSKKKV